MANEKNAIYIRGACKSYGKGRSKTVVLKDLDMTVPKGCIYGLLGASGCGKTTLLSSFVGRKSLDSGQKKVLGKKDGEIPVHRVGYMPQEIALMEELTIEETIRYFSWIYGMPDAEFHEKLSFYLNLLELPQEKRLISKLSGGQQRRVSLMVSLFHEPELLILDEPTVGVDPMLRQRVWDHLVEETRKYGKTVIITTHYIEEARQADIIGLLRGGRLLAEDSPERLLSMHNTDSLEDVFLELSLKQEKNLIVDTGEDGTPMLEITSYDCDMPRIQYTGERRFSNNGYQDTEALQISKGEDWERRRRKRAKLGRWKALLLKNGIRFFRNPESLAFNFIFPFIQVCLFFLAIGGDPRNLPIVVINQDVKESNFSSNCSNYVRAGCDDPNYGCRYIELLSESKYFQINFMNDIDRALEYVRWGKAWGTLVIPENFTESMKDRRDEGHHADDDLLETGSLGVYLDMSNDQIGMMIRRQLIEEFVRFSGAIMDDCGLNKRLGVLPIRFKDPIYGEKNSTFTEFSAPASILTTIFFMAVAMTSDVMVTERHEGLWDRTLVAGLTAWELLLGHIILQIFLVFLQSVEALFIAFVMFGFPCNGSMILSLLLTWFQGISGMCCGFLVSVSSRNLSESNYFSTGCFYPIVLMGGSIWPLQGTHWFFQKLCYIMPTTTSNVALRHILIRGWGIQKATVLIGFASTLAWIAVFLFLCHIVLRIKK